MKRWSDLTWEDFSTLDPETWVAVLPVAATEQHGPHLPVSVDADINAGVIESAFARAPQGLKAIVLPMLPIGKSNEHSAYPGTLSLRAETLIALWTDVGESVARTGLRKLVFLNSHGGQPQVVDIVARDLRVRLGMLTVTASTYGFGLPDGLFSETEERHGIHAGEIETSMMLHLRPAQVKRERFEDFAPASVEIEQAYTHLRLEGPVGMGWMTQDLHPLGAAGDARNADAERGRKCLDHSADALLSLLQEVSCYPLSRLKAGPRP